MAANARRWCWPPFLPRTAAQIAEGSAETGDSPLCLTKVCENLGMDYIDSLHLPHLGLQHPWLSTCWRRWTPQ
ncbi:hypothetical protein LNQ03_22780 [Klebsiella pneumoniae subsp. pneumoniae]|nr:hypothetical protein [Klebsiella pneumoniae subsp. pneumoniae]